MPKSQDRSTLAPLLDRLYHEFGSPGNVWYVAGDDGSPLTRFPDAGSTPGCGVTPDAPFLLLSDALTAATPDQNDWIIFLAGHNETISGAGGINLTSDMSGLKLFSAGHGRQRATFNFDTSTAASFDINAANTLLRDVVFLPLGIDAIVAAVNIKAADCTLEDFELEHANGSAQAKIGILTTNAADRLTLRRFKFHGTTDAGTDNAIKLVGGSNITIEDGSFLGAYDDSVPAGALYNVTTAVRNLILRRLIINNMTASSRRGLVLDGSTSGTLEDISIQILSGTSPVGTPSGMQRGRGLWYAAALNTTPTAF